MVVVNTSARYRLISTEDQEPARQAVILFSSVDSLSLLKYNKYNINYNIKTTGLLLAARTALTH